MKGTFRTFLSLVGAMMILASSARAQECTSMWQPNLDTDPNHAKGMAGDTVAAYAVFAFQSDPTKTYVLKGNFPDARFMSLDAGVTKKQHTVDTNLDYQIDPDLGSVNPFRPGAAPDAANRAFTVTVSPDPSPAPKWQPNHLSLPIETGNIHSVFFRIYAPNKGAKVTLEDLPRIYAYDKATGQPAACPTNVKIPFFLHYPQFLTVVVRRKVHLTFKDAHISWGPNAAIPYYLYAPERMRQTDEVLHLRFKAPSFVDTSSSDGSIFSGTGNVRFWSLCAINITKIQTLACAPDFLTPIESDGYANIVYGKGEDVKRAAEEKGYYFLEDTRFRREKTVVFAYRNLLPEATFKKQSMYQADYRPVGTLCSSDDFVAGSCD